MQEYQLDDFAQGLATIRDFLAELASENEHRLPNSLGRWIAESKLGASALIQLEEAPAKIESIRRLSQLLDRSSQEDIKLFLDKSDLITKLVSVAAKVRIALAKSHHTGELFSLTQAFKVAFLGRPGVRFFKEGEHNLEQVISDVSLLRGKVISMKDILSQKRWSDQEGFKPSNIDNEKFIELVEQAIQTINSSPEIPETIRKQLIASLQQAKSEVLSRTPSWSKIVGALVIAFTIVSGLADVDEAFDNLKKAFDYVVGHSVVVAQTSHSKSPFTLPPPRLERPKKAEDGEDSNDKTTPESP